MATKSQSGSDEGHVYELKKIRMSQDKDGHLVVLRVHPNDAKTPLVEEPCGTVFEGPLRNLNYVDIT
jgi:hypothetical protein